MDSEGKWEICKPDNVDEERLKAVVQHLIDSKAVSVAQSFCDQCAVETQKEGGNSNYVPVIMLPIYPAEQCPFDLECNAKKITEPERGPLKKPQDLEKDSDKDKRKLKKRPFMLQRLTDFDLLSQW